MTLRQIHLPGGGEGPGAGPVIDVDFTDDSYLDYFDPFVRESESWVEAPGAFQSTPNGLVGVDDSLKYLVSKEDFANSFVFLEVVIGSTWNGNTHWFALLTLIQMGESFDTIEQQVFGSGSAAYRIIRSYIDGSVSFTIASSSNISANAMGNRIQLMAFNLGGSAYYAYQTRDKSAFEPPPRSVLGGGTRAALANGIATPGVPPGRVGLRISGGHQIAATPTVIKRFAVWDFGMDNP